MKIILSRKGFDSNYGGGSSPIFPSGEIFSLPIPGEGQHSFKELQCGNVNIGHLIKDFGASIKGETIKHTDPVHLDPDLRRETLIRENEWLPCFGQAKAAQRHLENNNVGRGDLFLFFGSFRNIHLVDKKWMYVKKSQTIHLIFGWLQIGLKYSIGNADFTLPYWLQYHDHYHAHRRKRDWPNNTIYVASQQIRLGAKNLRVAGGGVFSHFDPKLQLTAETQNFHKWRKGLWSLPKWFYPSGNKLPLTYHRNINRWHKSGDQLLLDTAPIGQEFVLDCEQYPEALGWAEEILNCA